MTDKTNSKKSTGAIQKLCQDAISLGTEKVNKMCQFDRGKTIRLHEEPSRPTLNDFTVASWYEARNRVMYHAYMKMP